MAKAKKLESGNWRVQIYDYTDKNGKKHYRSFTAQTKAQAEYLANSYKFNRPSTAERQASEQSPTVRQCVNEYIEQSRKVLSPATIRGYEVIAKNRFTDLMDVKITDLDSCVLQESINKECDIIVKGGEKINPKTVCSSYGLISAALKRYNLTFNVRLPKKIKKIKDFPDPKVICDAVKGADIELPCLLAMWLSLSMSELRGIDCSAISGEYLHIQQVRVYLGEDVVKKTGKTDSRIRIHHLPPYLMQLINNTDTYKKYCETGENAPLIALESYQIYKRWKKICNAQRWEMTFHDLRAMSASVMLLLGIPDKYAQERGGWKTDKVMKTVYQQTLSAGRIAADEKIDSYFESIING